MTAAVPPPGQRKRRVLRVVLVLLGVVAAVVAGVSLWARHQLRASLPQLEGSRAVAGLGAAEGSKIDQEEAELALASLQMMGEMFTDEVDALMTSPSTTTGPGG